jgi:hypothetical protein
MQKRSKGVTIIGWFYLLGEMLTILGTFSAALRNTVESLGYLSAPLLILSAPLLILSLFRAKYTADFLLAIIGTWVAWGLLGLKKWARKWIIYLMCIGIGRLILWTPFAISKYAKYYHGAKLTQELWWMGVTIGLSLTFHFFYIYFFTRPKVKEQFK